MFKRIYKESQKKLYDDKLWFMDSIKQRTSDKKAQFVSAAFSIFIKKVHSHHSFNIVLISKEKKL